MTLFFSCEITQKGAKPLKLAIFVPQPTKDVKVQHCRITVRTIDLLDSQEESFYKFSKPIKIHGPEEKNHVD
jgi:hypothetical protein